MDTKLTTNTPIHQYAQNLNDVNQAIVATGNTVEITAGEVAEVITACTPLVAALGGMFSACCGKKTDKTKVKPEFEITQVTEAPIIMNDTKVTYNALGTREVGADKK